MTKIEINETELNKILKNVESEINKNMILNNKLRKDSEQFLKIVLQKRNNDLVDVDETDNVFDLKKKLKSFSQVR